MRILITNDDGIHGEGLRVLQEIAAELSDDVWTVAPETNQSGVSHSLTLHDPLRCRKVSDREFAVTGTPTDCVLMAVLQILGDKRPDLVLSGVNKGQNTADDVTYSGTIAGAIEGTLLGIPSVALSQARNHGEFSGDDNMRWETARTHGAAVLRKLLAAGWPREVLINVNFPDCAPGDIRGLMVTRQGQRNPGLLRYERREDMRGEPYYWLRYRRNNQPPEAGTDLAAIRENRISITPLHLDLTHFETCHQLARSLES